MEDQVESTTNNFGEYGVVRDAECGFFLFFVFILLRYNLTDRKTLNKVLKIQLLYKTKSDILNRVRLLKAVQYLSLMNLIKPTAVYI